MSTNTNHIDDSLLMLFITGEADDKQLEEVQLWLDLSDENQAYLDQMQELWLKTLELKPAPINVNIDAAWDRVAEIIDSLEKEEHRNFSINRRLMRIAAALLLALGVYLIYNLSRTNAPEQILMVSADSILSDTLSDGSVIALNKNSQLTYPKYFDKDKRQIKLQGEAFFEIEPDPEKTFIIEAKESFIQVLGTSFNVEAYADSATVEVSVVTGVVKLFTIDKQTSDTNFVILTANEIGVFDTENNTIEKLGEYDKNTLYWQSKTLIFEKTKLSEVFTLLELTYNVNINVANDTINNYLLSASFKDNTIEDILTIISASFNLSFSIENNTFIISEYEAIEK